MSYPSSRGPSRYPVDSDSEGPYVAADELTEPFTTILHARRETALTEAVDTTLERRNGALPAENTDEQNPHEPAPHRPDGSECE
jgi:hypothetical protein